MMLYAFRSQGSADVELRHDCSLCFKCFLSKKTIPIQYYSVSIVSINTKSKKDDVSLLLD